MKYLITGGCGFLGSNLASHIIKSGDELIIFDNLSRVGSEKNLSWLRDQGDFQFIKGDVRKRDDVDKIIKDCQPDTIFHLAGQVAMTTSITHPREDFEINVLGSINVLEAVRNHAPHSAVIYSSTNKVYGDLESYAYREKETRYECVDKPNGFDESTPLAFHSPYGCSKGAADQYMLDYQRIYGLKTVVFRHSSMYGGRQFATYDQGWVGWFISKAIEVKNNLLKKPFTINGNGKQVRDLLYASDMVSLYFKASKRINTIKGHAFNIGGGIENSSSLIELFHFLEKELDIIMPYTQNPPRESDQLIFIADIAKIKDAIGWQPNINKETGLRKMIEWIEDEK